MSGKSIKSKDEIIFHKGYDKGDVRPSVTLGSTTTTFGMELEVEVRRQAEHMSEVLACLTSDDSTYELCYDGSLSYGFEAVTAPMTYEGMCDWIDNNKDAHTLIEKLHYVGENGIHIHVGRKKPIRENESEKMLELKQFIMADRLYEQLAQLTRYCDQWADAYDLEDLMTSFILPQEPLHTHKYHASTAQGYHIHGSVPIASRNPFLREPSTVSTFDELHYELKETVYNTRYYFMNFKPHNTIEARIFNVTDDKERLKKYVRFVDDFMRLSLTLSIEDVMTHDFALSDDFEISHSLEDVDRVSAYKRVYEGLTSTEVGPTTSLNTYLDHYLTRNVVTADSLFSGERVLGPHGLNAYTSSEATGYSRNITTLQHLRVNSRTQTTLTYFININEHINKVSLLTPIGSYSSRLPLVEINLGDKVLIDSREGHRRLVSANMCPRFNGHGEATVVGFEVIDSHVYFHTSYVVVLVEVEGNRRTVEISQIKEILK